ncbi:MAG TPA: (2Fe-2S)-binding protein, partial [Burkholderiales bacterium]|nr:(2Fe-2S)-binding protein [Burkholderiales bacterium]
DRPGVRLSLAAEEAPGEELLQRVKAAFSVDASSTVRYGWLKDLRDLEVPRGRTVCNCLDVAQGEIEAFLAASKSLAELQASLKCGTNCGSCLPELRRMAAAA